MDYFLIAAAASALVLAAMVALAVRLGGGWASLAPRARATDGGGRRVGAGTVGGGERARLGLTIELGTHLDLTSFVAGVNNQAAAVRRRRGGGAGAGAGTEPGESGGEEAARGEGARAAAAPASDDKMGAKKRAKLEAKEERRLAREAEERSREARRVQQQQRDAELRAQHEQQEQHERDLQLHAQRLEEERLAREQAEYEELRAAFSVEGEGEAGGGEGEGAEGRGVGELVRWLQQEKAVSVERAAAWLRLPAHEAARRLQELAALEAGALDTEAGALVAGERGAFVWVSRAELAALAAALRQRGRVSVAALAAHANTLVRLQPLQPLQPAA